MNFEQATQALDTLTQALKNGEQKNIMSDNELNALRDQNAGLSSQVYELRQTRDKAWEDQKIAQDKLETETRNNGELQATLKQLLAEQMALASRAAEMLRSLETPPTMIPPKTIAIVKPTFASEMNEAHKKNQEERLLELHVETTLNDIAKVPPGETFILDAPYGERITDWILKKWYRRILGKAPGNFKDAPSIALYKEDNGGWTFLRQTPKLTNTVEKEDREPIPFRTEEANTPSNGKTSDPFNDNGEAIPGFLNRGPKSDADHEREERA